jgi:hypothetical protein
MRLFRLFFIVSLLILIDSCNTHEPSIQSSFSGNWKCKETSSISASPLVYTTIIEQSKLDSSHYIIRNILNTGINYMLIVEQKDSVISMLEQPTSGHIISTFEGKCTPYSSITLNFTVYDGEKEIYYKNELTRN